MKNITQFSVKYPVTVFMMVLGILLLGYISFDRLGIDLFPNLNNPKLFIKLTAGERPPEEIEKNFTDYLESLAIRQSDVVNVTSISKVGSAQITVEYSWDKDMDEAFLDLQKTISSSTQSWDVDELTISQYDPNATPIMTIALSHQSISDMNELRKTAENYIRNELIRLEGIADVEISGAEEKEVNISTDRYVLEAHGLTLDDLTNQIEKFNRNVSGGSIVEMGTQYTIKGVSIFQEVDDFKKTIIAYKKPTELDSNSAPVYLEDIAKIEFKNKEPENYVYINGKRCVGLSIYKETKFNTVKAVSDLEDELVKLTKALPGYEFVVVENKGTFITASIDEVEETALIGIVLAVIILFVFLRRFGVTMIISTAIPISIVATFNLMYFNDLTLNIMTLGGLALGAGMLVDNAIVVMENIYRNLESGMSIKEASITGASQVGGAITASTITTIVVFLPIVYLHGASGELFKDQAWTVAFSLISSLFVAIMFIPMLSSIFLKDKKVNLAKESIQFNGYGNFLSKVIAKRWLIIIIAVIMVGVSLVLVPFIGSEFMPKTESSEITVNLTLSEGTDLQRTASTIKSLESIIREKFNDKMQYVYSQAGPTIGIESNDNTFFENENTGFIKLIFTRENSLPQNQLINELSSIMQNIPGLEYTFTFSENSLSTIAGTDEAPIVIEVQGENLDVLEELTNEVESRVANMASLSNIESTFEKGAPEIEIEIDKLKAGIYNVSVSDISSQLSSLLNGKKAGSWDYEGELNNITIELPDITLKQLEDVKISSGGSEYRLSELANIHFTSSPKEIYRRNQNRIGKITAQINDDKSLAHIAQDIQVSIADIQLPTNYKIEITGEEELRAESMSNLTFALLLSIILVYMALASQFESLIHPFTILLTIPLAGVGAVLIFAILGMSFNIMAFIGIIMLAGIAVNDSIILVDAIIQLQNEGVSRIEAIVEAGQRRIRPIIMTSLTTILALLPLTIGFGEGAALRAPMALAVVGGLITSTILTLIVIPCVFYLFDVFKEKITQ